MDEKTSCRKLIFFISLINFAQRIGLWSVIMRQITDLQVVSRSGVAKKVLFSKRREWNCILLLDFCLGFILVSKWLEKPGLVLGYWFGQKWFAQDFIVSSIRQRKNKTYPGPKLLVGLYSNSKYILTRGEAIYDTWLRKVVKMRHKWWLSTISALTGIWHF